MRPKKTGFTLVELIAALALVSTILTVVAVALGGLARADRSARLRIDQQRRFQQFVVQLRTDLHTASSVEMVESDMPATSGGGPTISATSLLLTCNDGRSFRYQATEQGVERSLIRNEQPPHREAFTWGKTSSLRWTIETEHEVPMVVLELTMADHAARPATHHVVRTALLNANTLNAE